MKRIFVLDENVIISAQTGRDDRGEDDPASIRLIREIDQNCHTISLTSAAWGKYASQVRGLQRRREAVTPESVMKLLRDVLANSEKHNATIADEELPDWPELDGMRGVDEGDKIFAKMAAAAENSVLVTTDGAFIEALKTTESTPRFVFPILRPEEALLLAGPDI